MKHLWKVLIATAVMLALVVIPATATANPGTPIIDGIVTAGEWNGATVIPVESLNDLETRLGRPLTTLNVVMGTVSVLAYTDYLYVLFNVTDSTDARSGQPIGNDKIAININPTPGGAWGKPYDIVFQTGADPAAFTTPDPNPDDSSSGLTDAWKTEWCIVGNQLPLPVGIETRTIYSGDMRVSEWKIPLSSIALTAGDTLKVGGACDNLNNSGDSFKYPVGLDWGTVLSYQLIPVVAGQSVALETNVLAPTICVSVTPGTLNLGSVYPGHCSPGGEAAPILVLTNCGSANIVVTTLVTGALYTAGLQLYWTGYLNPETGHWHSAVGFAIPLESGASLSIPTRVCVPAGFTVGPATGTIHFIAAAQ